ncbi:MAG: hypothetical protein AAF378_14670 [Cyanobacteria bacterium P01_A01_bin.84]
MNNGKSLNSKKLDSKLQDVNNVIFEAVKVCEKDSVALLALLRQVEHLHREIREGVFQESLPDNRQALYSLLKEIEAEGGWPYIERMRLKAFLSKMLDDSNLR